MKRLFILTCIIQLFLLCLSCDDDDNLSTGNSGMFEVRVNFTSQAYECHTVDYGYNQINIRIVNPSGSVVHNQLHTLNSNWSDSEYEVTARISNLLTATGDYVVAIEDPDGYEMEVKTENISSYELERNTDENIWFSITSSEAGC